MINNIKRGFDILIKNPRLLLPDIILLIFILIFSGLFVFISGVYTIIFSVNFEESLRSLISNTPELMKVLLTLAVAALLSFITGITTSALKYELIKNIFVNKKITFMKAFSNSKYYFLPILYLKIATFIIYIIPLLILVLLVALFKSTILAAILIGLLLILYIILTLAFLFRYPILFLKTKKTKEILLASYNYFKQKKAYSLLLVLSIFIVSLILSLFTTILNILLAFAQNLGIVFTILFILYVIIRILVNMVTSVWVSVFIFISYKK